jgi:hypothetical protein
MQRAAALILLALLIAAPVFAQTSAGASNHPSGTPQTSPAGTMPPSAAASGEDMQRGAPPAQSPAAGAGQPADQPATPEGAKAGSSPVSTFDQVTAGTEVRAALDTPLSTKTSKPGDRFTATITQPVQGSNGGLVIPTGARVEGEVADADEGKAVAALRGKSKLSLRFRDIVLPAGQTIALAATLISVNDTNGKNLRKTDEEGQIQSSTRNKDIARDVGTGANPGTATGMIFGSPLKGLAIGALSGGGYVLATKGKEVNLPAQTGMVIRLDQPVSGNGTSASQQR